MVKKLLTQIKHKTLTGEEVVMDIGAKASNVLPENFVEQKERSNLAAKDKLPVIFGKLSKWYTDLKAVAWSGSYLDLTNKPTIPEGSAANYQVANNDTTEAEGFVADARIVRTHGLEIDGLSRDLNAINDNGAIKGMDAREDGVYITYSTGADTVTKKLGSFQRKLLGRVTSSTTFDCKSIPGWEDFTENNFAIIPVKIDATGGQWKNGATGAGGAQQGGCTPTLSYDKVNGILKVSNFSWNNDYAYGSYWTNYCHGNMTADVYCYHF